ncbi:TPA: hypothetical protein ACPUM6_005527 [Klebsiella pneumoniae]
MQTELIKELNKVLKAFPQFWSGEDLRGRLGNGQYCTVSLFFEQSKSSQLGELPRYTTFSAVFG